MKHRRRVPFLPVVEVPGDFSERALEVRRLDAELERVVLRAEDYAELAMEAMAQNIHYSTRLEGNPLPLQEVRRITRRSFRGDTPAMKNPGHQEIVNHLMAWRAPVMPAHWSIASILQLHLLLLHEAEPAARPGSFRDADQPVTEGGEAAFIPAPHQHIREELEALVHWVNRLSGAYFPVVAAAVMFHRFESIHPFVDGNGRTGRTLFHAYLQQRGLRHAHLCIIEPHLVSDTSTYYTLLAWTDHSDSYLELVDYFTDALLTAYREANERFQAKNLLSSDLDETAKRLLVMAKRYRSAFTLSEAATWVDGRAEDTVRRHLNRLVELGALRSEGRTKAKRYVFADPFEGFPGLKNPVRGK